MLSVRFVLYLNHHGQLELGKKYLTLTLTIKSHGHSQERNS
jgi:hypothetical protein